MQCPVILSHTRGTRQKIVHICLQSLPCHPTWHSLKGKKKKKKIYNYNADKIMTPTFVLERMVRNKKNKKWQFDLISFLFELNKKLLFTVIRTTCSYQVKINVTICRIHITNSNWFNCLNQQAFCRWKICSDVESLNVFSSFIICDFKWSNLN